MSTSLSLTLPPCDSISVTFDLKCDHCLYCDNSSHAGICKPLKSTFTLPISSCALTLLQAFRITDEALLGECASRGWTDGACAVRRPPRGRREAYR